MKLLLTSGGITNSSIASAFTQLVGKPPQHTNVVFIPTAANYDPGSKEWLINDMYRIKELGYKLDIVNLELLETNKLWPRIETADVLFVGGGNTLYLSYWCEKSGLFARLPELLQTKVYAGISAGTMVATDSLQVSDQVNGLLIDNEYDESTRKDMAATTTARLVPFLVRPHFRSVEFPKITDVALAKVAGKLQVPMYAIDDQTAIKVVDGVVEVVSEGTWQIFNKEGKES